MEESVSHLKQFSKGICMTQVIPQIIGAIVFLCISITFFTLNVNDRDHVDVKFKTSTSSHRKVSLFTTISTTQTEVTGINTTPPEKDTTRPVTEKYYDKQEKKFKTRTVDKPFCLGETYTYDMDGETKSKTFSEKSGKCKRGNIQLIVDGDNVIKKTADFKYNCKMETNNPEDPSLNQNLTCGYTTCPPEGTYNYALKISTNRLECPEVLRGKYNTCSITFDHGEKEYSWTEQIKGVCEDLVDDTKKLYYSKETDDFKREWNAPYKYIRSVGFLSLVVSIVLSLHVWLTVKVEMYCHVRNALTGVNMIKDKING
jgi:hypothetical protein